jgi:hypothetical protein
VNTPLITQLINGYDFFWADEQIQIKVTRIDAHHDGRVSANVQLCTTKEGYQPTLMQPFQINNFAALRTIEQHAKSLKAAYPIWDWPNIMSTLAYKVQELARAGEPSQEMWIDEEEEVPEIEYLVDPLILKSQPTVLFGDKEASKSTLACFLYICLTLPWHDNPLALGVLEKPTPTLYLDWETDASIFKWTMKRLRKGHNLPTFPVNYRHCENGSLSEDIEAIQQDIDKTKAKVIIIDSIGQAAGGEDLEKPKSALDLYKALRKLKGVTPLMIGQNSKAPATKKNTKSLYGTTFFQYYARSIFELVKSSQMEEVDKAQVGIFHRYCNYTAHHAPIGYMINYTPTSIRLEPSEVSIADFMEKISVNSLVLDILKREPLTVDELMGELGLKRNTIIQALRRLKLKNKVIKVDEKWGLVSFISPTPEEYL